MRPSEVPTLKLPPSALQPLTSVDIARAAGLAKDANVVSDAPVWAGEAKVWAGGGGHKVELEALLGKGFDWMGVYVRGKVDGGEAV